MKATFVKLLTSIACFTAGTKGLWADYYVTSPTTGGTGSLVVDCSMGNSGTCSLLDAIAQNNAAPETIHITVPLVTYTSAIVSPCAIAGTTIQSDLADGSVIDFGPFTSTCTVPLGGFTTVFQAAQDTTLTNIVLQNSISGGNVINFNGVNLTINGTSVNNGADSFSNNAWLEDLNFGSLIFGTTGDVSQPFIGNITFQARALWGITNTNASSVTVNSNITSLVDNRSIFTPNASGAGDLIFTGVINCNGNVRPLGGTIRFTGTSNIILNLDLGSSAVGTSVYISADPNSTSSSSFIRVNAGRTLNFANAMTMGPSNHQFLMTSAGECFFNDNGFDILINSVINSSASGIYAKQGSGVQTFTNNSNNFSLGLRIYGGAVSISNVSQLNGPIVLSGGALFASTDVTLTSPRTVNTSTTGGLAAGAGATFTITSNLLGSGVLTIGCPIASLSSSGTVLLNNATPASNTFTGGVFIGALDGSNVSYPATLSVGAVNLMGTPSSLGLQGGGIFVPTTSFSLQNTGPVNIPVTVGTGSGSFAPGTGIVLTIPGNISDAGGSTGSLSLTLTGVGTTILSGDNSGFTGNMVLSGASTLSISESANLGSSSSLLEVISSGCTVVKTGSGTVEMLPSSDLANSAFTLDVQGGSFITNTYFLGSSTVTLAASTLFEFEQAVSATYSGAITGSGDVIKSDAGVLTLTNNSNNWIGDTEISGGFISIDNVLEIGNTSGIALSGGGFFGSSNLTLPNTKDITLTTAGALAAGSSATLIVQGDLLGSGTVSIGSSNSSLNATGTVELQGTGSTFTGSFVVGAVDGSTNYPATLSLSTLAPLGTPTALTLQGGGVLKTTGSFSLGSIPLSIGSGAFAPDPGVILTVPGDIASLGGAPSYALGIQGGGTTILSGDNSGFMGNVTLSDASTLSISESANLGSSSSTLVIASTGCTIIKTGSGTLELLPSSDPSNPEFDLEIQDGSFVSNVYFLENATIDVSTGATLEFDQTVLGTYSGSISGGGEVIKTGTGSLYLTGDSTYTGKTYVNEGNLVVNGDISASPDPIVAVGATLSGTGTVGTTIVDGTIAGGDPFGTLTIIGDLTLNAGSIFETTVSATETSLVTVSNTVTISDAAFHLTITPGSYSLKDPRVVLIGEGGITGQFSSIEITNPFAEALTIGLTYTGTEVFISQALVDLESFAIGLNALHVAETLDAAAADLPEIVGSLLPLATTNKRATYGLNQLHPAQLKGMMISQENNALRVREAITQRIVGEMDVENCLTARRKQSQETNSCEKKKRPVTAWIGGVGDTLVQDNVDSHWGPLTGYRTNTGGAVAGMDGSFAKHFYAGLMGAYTNSNVHFENGKGTGSISSGYGGVYVSALGKIVYANAAILGSWNEYAVERHIQYGKNLEKVNLTAKSNHGGRQILSHFDTGLNFTYAGVMVHPFDSFDYMSQTERGYHEHNAGQWELTVKKSNGILIRNELGLQFAKCFCAGSSKWTVSPKISWVREVRKNKGDLFEVKFTQGGAVFPIHGYFPDRSLVAPGLAIGGLLLDDALMIDLYYNGEFKGGYSSNSVGGQIGYSF